MLDSFLSPLAELLLLAGFPSFVEASSVLKGITPVLVGLLCSVALLVIVVGLPFLENFPSLLLGPFLLEGPFTDFEEVLFLAGLFLSEVFLFLLVGLPFSENFPSLLLGLFLLEGPFTDFEEVLFLAGLFLSEVFLFLFVGLPFLEEISSFLVGSFLFDLLLRFVFRVSCLHVHCTILTVQFTVVLGSPLMQGHVTSTEELASVGASILVGTLALLEKFLSLTCSFPLLSYISHSWRKFSSFWVFL
jgi:hypothetical protein